MLQFIFLVNFLPTFIAAQTSLTEHCTELVPCFCRLLTFSSCKLHKKQFRVRQIFTYQLNYGSHIHRECTCKIHHYIMCLAIFLPFLRLLLFVGIFIASFFFRSSWNFLNTHKTWICSLWSQLMIHLWCTHSVFSV